ncbi:MAG: VWA domain-containing protein [Acidobacteriia bacterium]|nr:VWA domain-containing protein [Terriglobia bacterium]
MGELSTGQTAPPISVEVKGVTLLATVRDSHGQFVRNLSKDDFLLEQDGHTQVIRYFTLESNVPLTLGLLVDTSLSQRRLLDQERRASNTFLDQMMRQDKDKAFVIHFDQEVELLQDLTSSHQDLKAALGQLQTPQSGGQRGNRRPDSNDSGRDRGEFRGAGTLLYDAIYLASHELMAKQQGRKALIILSDGADRGSRTSLDKAIESAQRADTLVYSILFKDDEPREREGGFGRERGGMGGRWPGGGGMGRPGGGMGRPGGGQRRYPQESRTDGRIILERISAETGGSLYEVSKKLPVDQIYAHIQEELRNQYSLGFTPEKVDYGPGYHMLHLATRQNGLTVQTRLGYYAAP